MAEPGNVVLMALTAAMARRLLDTITQDSSRIDFTTHARDRMRERGFTTSQVLCCLKHGRIVEGPARDVKGNWKLNIQGLSAGDVLTCVVALDHDQRGDHAIVVTVF